VASLICNNNNSISVEINHITTLHSHSPGGWTIGQWWPRSWDVTVTPSLSIIRNQS
jgi:hypothetical protein